MAAHAAVGPEPGLWLQFHYGDGPRIAGRPTWLLWAWLAWSRFRVIVPLVDKTLPTSCSACEHRPREVARHGLTTPGRPSILDAHYPPRHRRARAHAQGGQRRRAAFLAIDHGETVAWHTLESFTAIVRRHRPDDTVNGRRKIASIKSPPAESTFSAVSDDMSTLAGGRC
jgi:hypothetical protein